MIWPRDVFFLSVWQEGINYDYASPPAFFWMKQADKELEKKEREWFSSSILFRNTKWRVKKYF